MTKTAATIPTPPRATAIRPSRAHVIPRRQELRFRWRTGGSVVGKNTVYAAHYVTIEALSGTNTFS